MHVTQAFWVGYILVALIGSGVFAFTAVTVLRFLGGLEKSKKALKSILFEQSFFTIERTAFFLIAAYGQTTQALTLGFIWMGLKLAANWNRDRAEETPDKLAIGALSALAGSLVSLGFSILGGMIAKGRYPMGF